MGYWAKDGSYIYDEEDLEQKERMNKEMRSDVSTTAVGSNSIYDASEDTLQGIERMNKAMRSEVSTTTVGSNSIYDASEDTLQGIERMNRAMRSEVSTTAVGSNSIYDASEDTIKSIERMNKAKRDEDAPNQDAINQLLHNLPKNSNDLIEVLEGVNFRLDLMKKLVEGYRNQFFDVAKQFKDDYSGIANEQVNNKLSEYLCLIGTLKSCGYNFGSERDSYNKVGYDPNKPETMLPEAMDMMQLRRKSGADIDIIFPVDYNLDDKEFQPKANAVTVINNVDEHLKNNPYMDAIWKKAGYVTPETTTSRSV